MQEWRKIKGYEKYSVSNNGSVRNDATGRILKLHISTSGYHQVMMGRKTIPQYVHRLVAIAFLPNESNKPQVDHIDGNKLNNNVNNLRWTTVSENCLGYGLEQRNEHRQKAIIARHCNGSVREFNSRNEAAEYFKCAKSEISYNREYKKGNKKGWIFEIKR